MAKKIYDSVLTRLAVEVPLFAESILNKALTKTGTNPSEVTAFQMKGAIEQYIEPMLKKNLGLQKGIQEIGAGIIVLDNKGKIRSATPPVHRLLPNLKNKKFTIKKDLTSEIIHSKDRSVEILTIPIISESGELEGYTGLISDITLNIELDEDIHSAYEKLHESEERYRDLFENANDLIQSVDANGKFAYVNKKWKEILGYSDEEIKKLKLTDILRKDQIPNFMKLFRQICKGKPIDDIETVFITKMGKEISVSGNANAFFKNKKFVVARGMFRDVTEQKKAEEKLLESEAWLSTTLRSIGDAIITTDLKSNISFMNHVAQSLTGWKHKNALGKPLEDVFKIIDQKSGKRVKNPAKRVLTEEVIVELGNHTLLINKNKEKIPIDDSAAPIKDKKGNVIGVVLIFRDITKKKKTEEELKKRTEELEKFNKFAVGRELKMAELKKRIKVLESK